MDLARWARVVNRLDDLPQNAKSTRFRRRDLQTPLQGRRGWILAADKQPFLDYHRRLHEAYTARMLSLMRRADPDLKSVLAVLYYKRDPRALDGAAGGAPPAAGTRRNTQTLWKKAAPSASLQDAVGHLRPFLEVVRYFCDDPRDRWEVLPWLAPAAPRDAGRARLAAVRELVRALLRSSDGGPDAPVHWAAHPALNHWPRSVVTDATMAELVVGTANILSHLFLPRPSTASDLAGVDALLSRFSAGEDGAPPAAREARPKDRPAPEAPLRLSERNANVTDALATPDAAATGGARSREKPETPPPTTAAPGRDAGREPGQEETDFRRTVYEPAVRGRDGAAAAGTNDGAARTAGPGAAVATEAEEEGPPPARPSADALRAISDAASDMDISSEFDDAEEDDPRATTPTKPDALPRRSGVCAVCGDAGELLACAACSLAFHVGCVRPRPAPDPPDDWRCAYCWAAEGNVPPARQACREMEATKAARRAFQGRWQRPSPIAPLSSPVDKLRALLVKPPPPPPPPPRPSPSKVLSHTSMMPSNAIFHRDSHGAVVGATFHSGSHGHGNLHHDGRGSGQVLGNPRASMMPGNAIFHRDNHGAVVGATFRSGSHGHRHLHRDGRGSGQVLGNPRSHTHVHCDNRSNGHGHGHSKHEFSKCPAPDSPPRRSGEKVDATDDLAPSVAAAAAGGGRSPEEPDGTDQRDASRSAAESPLRRWVEKETRAAADHAVLTRPPRRRGRDTELVVSPGVLGLALTPAPGGGLVTAVHPACTFRDQICVGDVIVTIDGRQISRMQDLKVGKERSRVFLVAHPQSSAESPPRSPSVLVEPLVVDLTRLSIGD